MDQLKPSQKPIVKSKSNEFKISFQPLSEGLGFHPFSDGLPYAPIAKNPRPAQTNSNTLGSGALSAGPPKMVLPQRPVPQISVPVAKPMNTAKKIQQRATTQQVFSLGYLFRRVVAQLLDILISAGLFAGMMQLFFWQGGGPELFSNVSFVVAGVCLWAGFHWCFVTFQELMFKTSLGKRMLGLRLPDHIVLILLRSLFFIPSVGFLGIGLIWSLFDRQRRCWHDCVVNIQPIDIYS